MSDLDISTVIKGGLRLLQRNINLLLWSFFVPFLVAIPMFIVAIVAAGSFIEIDLEAEIIDVSDSVAGSELAIFAVIIFVVILALVYITTRIQAGVMKELLASQRNDTQSTIRQAWKSGSKLVWPVIGASFLAALIIILGLVALIIPGLIAFVLLSLTTVAVVDGYSITDSLKQSRKLVKRDVTTVVAVIVAYVGFGFVWGLIANNIEAGGIIDLIDFFVSIGLTLVYLPVLVYLYESLNTMKVATEDQASD